MTNLKAPFLLPGDRTGCLLLHGFTSTPAEVRPLGEALHEAGYTVYAPLLPGHGTTPEDLLGVKCRDWIEGAQQGLNYLKRQCSSVIVIGHSMGGLLALQLAARNRVKGVVTIAAALVPANRLIRLARFVKYFVPYREAEKGNHPPEVQKYLLHYPRFPIAAVAELHTLTIQTKAVLPHITAPALIIQTRDDKTVRPESAEVIFNKISSRKKECFWMDEGTHNIPVMPPYNELVFAKVVEFISGGRKTHPTRERVSPAN